MVGIDKRLDKIEKQLQLLSEVLSEPGNRRRTFDNELNLSALIRELWSGKFIIVFLTVAFGIFSLVYSLSLPNIYRAEVLLAPADESAGGISSLTSQLGGLAGLAGVSIGDKGTDKTQVAIAILKSRKFLSKFIIENDILLPLMAAKNWDMSSQALVLDEKIYDQERKLWVRDVSPPKLAVPSEQEAHKKFSEVLTVNQDKKTNLITISIDFFSPVLAKKWIDLLVEAINAEIKSRDVEQALKSIKYLHQQLDKTPVADVQKVFYELIEEQSKTIMFAEVGSEYAFKTIDPSVVPEVKVKPKRSLLVFLGLVLGGFTGVFLLLLKRHFRLGQSFTNCELS